MVLCVIIDIIMLDYFEFWSVNFGIIYIYIYIYSPKTSCCYILCIYRLRYTAIQLVFLCIFDLPILCIMLNNVCKARCETYLVKDDGNVSFVGLL